MKLDVIYHSNIEFDGDSDKEEFKMPLPVKGVSFVTGYIEKKRIIIPYEEGDNIAKSLGEGIDGLGAYILKDHGFKSIMILAPKSVDLLVGRVKSGVRMDDVIFYSGNIEVDRDLAEKVYKRLVTSSSVGLHIGEVYCSICGRDYMDEECDHQFGKEYPDEGLHEIAQPYAEAMGGKALAVPVGMDVTAREQSVVLFPAIKGASIGLNFTEESENLLDEISKRKEEASNRNTNFNMPDDEMLGKLAEIIVTFNKDNPINNNENTMSTENLEQLTGELVEAKTSINTLTAEKTTLEATVSELTDKIAGLEEDKVKLETEKTDLEGKLETSDELVGEYKTKETARLEAEKTALVAELVELRKEREMPEKDYAEKSLEVIVDALENLKDLPKPEGQGTAGAGNVGKDIEQKEDVRELIFGKREDGQKLKGIRKLI